MLTYYKETATILLGPEIGSAETADGRLSVIGSGSTIRFSLEGVAGYVDLDLKESAGTALDWLVTRKRAAE